VNFRELSPLNTPATNAVFRPKDELEKERKRYTCNAQIEPHAGSRTAVSTVGPKAAAGSHPALTLLTHTYTSDNETLQE